ncbi:MAG: glycosyltransferase family 9 protein [Chthoniobacteraceae bacterium]|nr:glycosyltransferase family 9 protein [Chthoniobacteraceae bacterium]
MNRKILVLELWGIGDLALSTVLIRKAVEAGDEVHVLGKRHSALLLEPTFPGLRFILFDAGWTKFHQKYHLWRWNWEAFFRLLAQLRKEHYDAAVSARDDPRDHLLMALIGARERYGFSHHGSGILLTHPVVRARGHRQHKVEDWRDLGMAMGFPGMEEAQPGLALPAYRSARGDALFEAARKPVIVLHAGARIPVRRWPEPYFRDLIGRLRRTFDFHLVLIPDPDGYGSGLAPLADTVFETLSLSELIDVIGRASLLLCNDSGPAHLAAACGRPAITFFGPGHADWFHPWGPFQKIIRRDICSYRPCFDYCHFPEPYCMTKLLPENIWPEVRGHILRLVSLNVLPKEEFVLSESSRPQMESVTPLIVAVVATYRRPEALERMLRSLQSASATVAAVVVDNADDPQTAAVTEAEGKRMEVIRLVPGENLSCGGGLAYGERFALEHFAGRATHFLLSDDDVETAPGTLDRLVEALRQERASLACPMITWPDGIIGWFPGLLEAAPFDALRKVRVRTPEHYLAQFGSRPIRFSWATGACLMVTREALERAGLHRTDFWLRGEDFEFSLRVTAQGDGIFVPDTLVRHHCFGVLQTPEAIAAERRKQVAMLHNTAYIACRLPYGRRILRCLPGNLWRHTKNWGAGGIWEGLKAYWRGAVGGQPVGASAASPAPPDKIRLVYSLADQNFATTKSIGILNLSTALAEALAASGRIDSLTVLSNSTIQCALPGASARVLIFDKVIKNKVARLLWDQWGVYGAVPTAPGEWLFLPKGFASFLRKPPCRLAAYVHYTIFMYYGAHYPRQMPRFESVYFKTALKATIKSADVIFTNSAFTRGEVLRLAESLRLPPPPVVVAGIGFSALPGPAPAKKNQVMILVSKWPHKLTSLAIQYADRWQRETNYDGEILWVGMIDWSSRLPSHPGWRHFPRLPEEPFHNMLRESRVLVFFSDYEGFGMPPVEAAINLTYPVYSNIPAVSEAMGGRGGAFENGDYASFAKAMETALRCERAVVEAWSRELLETHPWTKVAATITNTLAALGAKRAKSPCPPPASGS